MLFVEAVSVLVLFSFIVSILNVAIHGGFKAGVIDKLACGFIGTIYFAVAMYGAARLEDYFSMVSSGIFALVFLVGTIITFRNYWYVRIPPRPAKLSTEDRATVGDTIMSLEARGETDKAKSLLKMAQYYDAIIKMVK